jgi:DNA-damage-inducible protein D
MSNIEQSNQSSFHFEDYRNEDNTWWASDLMKMVGYKDMKSFTKVIEKGIKACMTLNIPFHQNFIGPEMRQVDGELVHDYKLTRFACYITVMNGDPKKEEVAAAQVYFAENTRKFELIQRPDQFDRMLIRDEIKEGNKALMSTANQHGLSDFARFNNAGYMGLYNMQNWQLAKKRNVDSKKLYEYMGRTELAANLFRVTQTEERIKNFEIKGQLNLEKTHYDVGREVRNMVVKNTGKTPEQLPVEKQLPEVQKEVKQGYKKMLNEEKKSKAKKRKA